MIISGNKTVTLQRQNSKIQFPHHLISSESLETLTPEEASVPLQPEHSLILGIDLASQQSSYNWSGTRKWGEMERALRRETWAFAGQQENGLGSPVPDVTSAKKLLVSGLNQGPALPPVASATLAKQFILSFAYMGKNGNSWGIFSMSWNNARALPNIK